MRLTSAVRQAIAMPDKRATAGIGWPFSSIGIQIGGIGGIAPERRRELARLGFRAMLGGSLACFMTACVAGILL